MRYAHILSPIKVGDMVLKNRLISGNSLPHFLQGPEPYPAEPVINHVVTMAKNGAAIVTFADWTNMAQRAKKYQSFGFDMVTLHFAYRATLFGRFISPRTNRRTDEYGGSLENRARFLLELCARIKELCGKNFPIEVQITAKE